MGYPIIVVIGSKSCDASPKVELIIKGTSLELDVNSALLELAKYQKQKLHLCNE